MKTKEALFLAKLNLTTSKKINRIIVFMLSVSMIIIIPVFVLWISVNVSINNKINSVPYMLYSQVQMKDYRIETANEDRKISGFENINKFENIDSKIVYEKYNLPCSPQYYNVTMSVDGKKYDLSESVFSYNIIDIDKSSYNFPYNLNTIGDIFVDSCDASFDETGKKQVVLSQIVLDAFNLTSTDVYGNTISIYISSSHIEGYLCYEYKVVGIIKREISELYDESGSYMDSEIFFCSSNVYKDGNAVLKPTMTGQWYEYKYLNIEDKEMLNEEYMMLGIGSDIYAKDSYASTCIYLEESNYAILSSLITSLQNRGIYTENSTIYNNYKKLYDVSNILTFILGIVGGVSFIITLLYYYLNLKFSIYKRRHFLTIIRALGGQDCDIPKIHMLQSNILCAKAALIFAVIGGALCWLIKYVINAMISINQIPISITISPWIILASIITMIVIMFTITNLIALICSRKLSKQPIMSILKTQ